jgi:hypothetical protein
MFEPITAQIAISVFFFKAAVILAANSGRLVQIATIVTQIIFFGILKLSAILTALVTIKSHQ